MIFEYLAKYDFRKVVLCHNADVGLKAVIAVHSTALGPACGGLRMWTYASEEEAIMDALRLGRGMTYKYAAAGVNLGGGKAVIIGDPKTQKTEALIRAMGRFIQSLHGEYKTGEDVGTTLDDMELLYQETEHVITLPEYCGGAGNIGPATAFGVQQAMKACAHEVWGSDRLQGRTITVQGLGAVGWPAVEGLVKEGARVIVADIDPAKVERAKRELGVTAVDPAEIHAQPCDIYGPYALGAVINDRTLPELQLQDRVRERQQSARRGAPRRPPARARHPVRARLHRQRGRDHLRHRSDRPEGRLQPRAGLAERVPDPRAHGGADRHFQARADSDVAGRESAGGAPAGAWRDSSG